MLIGLDSRYAEAHGSRLGGGVCTYGRSFSIQRWLKDRRGYELDKNNYEIILIRHCKVLSEAGRKSAIRYTVCYMSQKLPSQPPLKPILTIKRSWSSQHYRMLCKKPMVIAQLDLFVIHLYLPIPFATDEDLITVCRVLARSTFIFTKHIFSFLISSALH